jgi:hypothetical protein
LKLLITSPSRSALVELTLAIPVTSMPCNDSNTICARRHVTTNPDERRTIRNNRFPSSTVTSRTRNPSLATPPPDLGPSDQTTMRDLATSVVDLQGESPLLRH